MTELTTLTNPVYLFEFIEEQTDDKEYCILSDTSANTKRFNEFSITDGVDVNFPIDGFYTYNIYEQVTGSTNLDPTGLNRVETGRAYIYIIDDERTEYTTTETNSVYE